VAASLRVIRRSVAQNVVGVLLFRDLFQTSQEIVRVEDREAAGALGQHIDDLLAVQRAIGQLHAERAVPSVVAAHGIIRVIVAERVIAAAAVVVVGVVIAIGIVDSGITPRHTGAAAGAGASARRI